MSERIYIPEIQSKLPYKDRRSVIRWCAKNGVRLFKDIGSKPLFALKNDFEYAYAPNRISPEILNSTIDFFSNYHQAQRIKAPEYKPQGEIEKQFLSILQSFKTAL